MAEQRSKKRRSLLYVINHMDWFWSHRLPLALGALETGWNVHVAAAGVQGDAQLRNRGFSGLELPPSDQGFLPLTVLRTIYSIHRHMAQHKPDLVHAITLKYAFMTGLAALMHPRIRIVHTIAGLGYLFSGEGLKPRMLRFFVGPFLKLALKGRHTRIVFQNPDDQALLIARGFVRAEQCHLIRGSGVDITQFRPQQKPKNDMPLIIMPTRLVHDKGVAVFIEAAKILAAGGVKARFQIAGGTTHNNPLAISAQHMQEMIAGSPVEWLGKVSDMPALFAAADLVVYPSYYREGIPKVLLEAAASGLPIITTDHPGCREAVQHKRNGLLVPVKDAQAVADAVAQLLADPPRLLAMGQESRKIAEELFDVRAIVRQTLAVYED